MHGPLGHASGAAREMQDGHVFRRGRSNRELVAGFVHEPKVILSPGNIGGLMFVSNQEDVGQVRQRRPQAGYFALIQ